jgi:hypothetical protein
VVQCEAGRRRYTRTSLGSPCREDVGRAVAVAAGTEKIEVLGGGCQNHTTMRAYTKPGMY